MDAPPDVARSASHRSAWEDGLDVIDSLLRGGSPTEAAMSDEQRGGLRKLKAMLLRGGAHSAEHHIPAALLTGDWSDDDDGASQQFLMSHFGGYAGDPGAGLKRIVAAHRVARRIKIRAAAVPSPLSSSIVVHGPSRDVKATTLPAQWRDLDRTTQLALRDLLSWDSLSRWDFDVFEVDRLLGGQAGGNTLVFVAWAILASPNAQHAMDWACVGHNGCGPDEDDGNGPEPLAGRPGYRFTGRLGIHEDTLVEFLHAVEAMYLPSPSYHNKIHAADVTQSLHAILQMGGGLYAVHPPDRDVELFALLLAAVIHDVGHPGENNLYQVHSRSDLALLYNDVSVLENMHVSTAFRLLMGRDRDERVDLLGPLTDEQIDLVRRIVVNSVLATDMTKHFANMNYTKGLLARSGDDDGAATAPPATLAGEAATREHILGFLLHLADISNPTKPVRIGTQWADRVLEEFFLQGDKEAAMALPVSPLCCRRTTRRAQSQIGFITYVVLPAYELVGELVPRISAEVVPHIRKNLGYWQEQKVLEDAAKGGDV